MFETDPFYHETLRRVSIIFGSMFNNISIQRFDATNTVQKTIKVPLSYGPAERWLARLRQELAPNKGSGQAQILLPRMSYELSGISYDASRKTSPLNKICATENAASGIPSTAYAYNRVPYNLNFKLAIITENIDDGLQIVEQILPYFTPDFNVSFTDNAELGITSDVGFKLLTVVPEDNYTDPLAANIRTIIWNLDFEAKAWLYKPTQGVGPSGIIKHVKIHFFTDSMFQNKLVDLFVDVVPDTADRNDPHDEVITIIDH